MVYTGKSGGGSCLEPVALEPVSSGLFTQANSKTHCWDSQPSCFVGDIRWYVILTHIHRGSLLQCTNGSTESVQIRLLLYEILALSSTSSPQQCQAFSRGIGRSTRRGSPCLTKGIPAVHAVMLERCCYNAFDVGEPLAILDMQIKWCRYNRLD